MLGNNTIATFTNYNPAKINGLFAWYKYDSIITANGTVSQVNDKTGNGRHAVQAVSGSQPLYFSSGGPNNKSYWAGVTNTRYLLAGADNDFNLLHNGSNWTIFFIARGSNQGSRVIFGTQNASGADLGFGLFEGGAGNNGYVGQLGNGTIAAGSLSHNSAGWTTGSFHKSVISFDAALTTGAFTSSIDTNTATGNRSGGLSGSNSGRKLGIGSSGAGSFITDTAWCEVLIFNKKLNSNEINYMNNYLRYEYGL